ncbi:hypothetical protein MYX88_004779 [Salmonella enterica]|nr:hypothetical protein [Salmonella enterica]EJC3639599.1 hypothetical protein [Salmonella enterica]
MSKKNKKSLNLIECKTVRGGFAFIPLIAAGIGAASAGVGLGVAVHKASSSK